MRHGTQDAIYAHATPAEGLKCKAEHNEAKYCMDLSWPQSVLNALTDVP